MYKPDDWDNIDAITTERPEPNYYILQIINTIDGYSKTSGGSMLKIEYDILEGQFKNYFTNVSMKVNSNILLRSTHLLENPKSLPYFKRLINVIEASNIGFKFDFEPESLKGKKVGAYLGRSFYESRYGQKEGLKIDKFFTVGKVRELLAKDLSKQFDNNHSNNNNELPFD